MLGSLVNLMCIFYIAALVRVLFYPENRRERIKEYLFLILMYPPIFAHNNFAEGIDTSTDMILVCSVFIIHSAIIGTVLWILNYQDEKLDHS
ncbi:hypothetical protein ACDX77_18910 [Bacillus velezensis]|uniref:hypothetical protein n=1 Tax=Bacillus velezensis TaxID=492670 RepID=UPI00355922E0